MNIVISNNSENLYPLPAFAKGAIYKSTKPTSPASIFGGTWVQIKDVFLYAASSGVAAGATGGKASVALTINTMPAHTHIVYGRSGNGTSYEGPNGSTGVGESYAAYSNTSDLSSQETGSGTAHNNMPPYKIVYMWRKVG